MTNLPQKILQRTNSMVFILCYKLLGRLFKRLGLELTVRTRLNVANRTGSQFALIVL